MRDTNKNMIELLDVTGKDNVYSSLIQHQINGKFYKLRFGILNSDYSLLKKIIEFRPFENTGVAPYRYFFALSYQKDSNNENLAFISIRIEQLDKHKQYEFKISKKYISNLLWFNNQTNIENLKNLIEK